MNNNTPPFRLGLDFHGVITDNPLFFSELTHEALQQNIEIHIITGGPHNTLVKFLDEWKICYHKLFTILDYYDAKGKVVFLDSGDFRVDDKLWDKAKGDYCRHNHINIHIDNSLIYGNYFTTPYCLYTPKQHSCSLGGIIIDFHTSPSQTIRQLLSIK